jgi:predicted transcriptional regulator
VYKAESQLQEFKQVRFNIFNDHVNTSQDNWSAITKLITNANSQSLRRMVSTLIRQK